MPEFEFPVPSPKVSPVPGPIAAQDEAFLAGLGEQVRTARARRGMTRKMLAEDSGLSERYLAQLESGTGNISVLLLRQVAQALQTSSEALLIDAAEPDRGLGSVVDQMKVLGPEALESVRKFMLENEGSHKRLKHGNQIALVGLRGAGKSTIGALLASRLKLTFIELDQEIEQDAGTPLNVIFDLYGQAGFRRLERHTLDRILSSHPRAVIATGGGIVSEEPTYRRLLESCITIWIKASPAEHMSRVLAQGDTRPMKGNREAMSDLRRILRAREALYARADFTIDTTRRGAEACADEAIANAKSYSAQYRILEG
jgi:XRE family transcriptional regulator, aerobic/anaerobic benzoate catabolism transcriptional regulator